MAQGQPAPTDVPLLRGLFGVLQAGAAQRLDTASIWSDLRTAAGSWQFQAQGLPQPFDQAAVTAAGTAILSAQGIRGDTVSTFRGVAGQWLGAKQALAQLGENAQITSAAIFTPPWASTNTPAVPSRYRIRTQWQIQPAAGEVFTQWRTDEITGPLSTLQAAVGQAQANVDASTYLQALSSGGPPSLLDAEIEQV